MKIMKMPVLLGVFQNIKCPAYHVNQIFVIIVYFPEIQIFMIKKMASKRK